MAVLSNNVIAGASIADDAAGGDAYQIEKSLRFNRPDTPYLEQTCKEGNRRQWTWSGWIKKTDLTNSQTLFSGKVGNGTSVAGSLEVRILSGTQLYISFCESNGTSLQWSAENQAFYRDPSAWQHWVIVLDTPNATANDRFRVYVNGKKVEDWGTRNTVTQNFEYGINKSDASHVIGAHYSGDNITEHFNGYFSDVQFIDGLALSAAAFGEFDSNTGVWNPKAFALPAPNTGGTWTPSSGGPTNAANMFDGSLSTSTSLSNSDGTKTVTTQSFTIKNSLRVYISPGSGYYFDWTINGIKYRTDGTGTTGWYTVDVPPNTEVTSFTVSMGPSSGDSIRAIEVDGVILVDGQTDPTTRDNPNNGTEWKNSSYNSGGDSNNYYKIFDGDNSDWMNLTNAASPYTFTPPAGIPIKSLRLLVENDTTFTCALNGGSAVSYPTPNLRYVPIDLADHSNITTLTSIALSSAAGGTGMAVRAIEINGQQLVSQTIDNSFHLKFSDTAANRNLGYSQVMNTPTGAQPMYGPGADDSAKSSLVLALPGYDLNDHSATIKGSGSNKTVTASGAVVSSDGKAKFYGNCLEFNDDGSNDVLSIANNEDLCDFGTGNFTMEAWIKPTKVSDSMFIMGCSKNATNPNRRGPMLFVSASTDNEIRFEYSTGGTHSAYINDGANGAPQDEWTHVAVVRNGNDCKLYLNGTQEGSTLDVSSISTSADNNDDPFTIGHNSDQTWGAFDGYMQDVRVYKGAAKYTANFTPPTRNDFEPANLVAATSVTDTTTDTIKNWRCYKNYSGTANYAVNYKIQWSNDNSTWTDAVSGNLASGSAGCGWVVGDTSYTGSQTAKYWKLKVLDITSNHAPRATKIDLQKADNSWVNVQTWNSGNEDCDDSGQYTWHNTDFTWTGGGSYSEVKGEEVDSVTDSPTNYGTDTGAGGEVRGNYCTLNPLKKGSSITLSNGNLDLASSGSHGMAFGTIGISSGKWYWEFSTTSSYLGIGVAEDYSLTLNNAMGDHAGAWGYASNGSSSTKQSGDATHVSYGSACASDDVIGVAFDADNGTLTFYKNGSSMGVAYSSMDTDLTYFPIIGDCTSAGNPSGSANFGQRAFKYTAPSGFKALCTQNLDDTFSGDELNNPSKYFDVKTYTGNGSGDDGTSQSIKGVNFQPDLVWLKARTQSWWHHLFDVVRGAGESISSNSNNGEQTLADNQFTSFDSSGFTVVQKNAAELNEGGEKYVSWMWDAGTAASGANNDGSINISSGNQWKNATAGFSITKYTGTQSLDTIGHGLNAKPDFIITKNLDTGGSSWFTYHSGIGATGLLLLDDNTQNQTHADWWNNTEPTNSVFTVNVKEDNNGDGDNHMAYCWTAIPGYSAFGKYTGTGTSTGPMVYCGFSPKWILTKNIDSSTNWTIFDTERDVDNVAENWLEANLTSEDQTHANVKIDILSNGFKLRGSDSGINASAAYIYAAFAEHPFKTARAR